MPGALAQKLSGVRDLKKILETTVKDVGEMFGAQACQIMLSNPLDANVTAICEYRADNWDTRNASTVSIPLVLQGRTFGSLNVSRLQQVTQDEVGDMRVILGELGDVIRHAQINDIVQRDTFRDTFLVEIGNVMAYSLGIGDALFMVVNILGKVLQASRCLFICTDDAQAGWKSYEFWQQGRVASCQDFRWPTTDSPVVAQTLLARAPLKVFEGQQNSYVSPVQEELQFIGVKSLLGIPLRTRQGTHGCVIVQQCDYRRAWTRNEIDMVQNVADRVADALVLLPEEKRGREPIMQLHQRIIVDKKATESKVPKQHESIESVRKALKGALGHQSIPAAAMTSHPAPAASAPKPVAQVTAKPNPATPTVVNLIPSTATNIPITSNKTPNLTPSPELHTPGAVPTQSARSIQPTQDTKPAASLNVPPPKTKMPVPTISPVKRLLKGARKKAEATPEVDIPESTTTPQSEAVQPLGNLFEEKAEEIKVESSQSPQKLVDPKAGDWVELDSIEAPPAVPSETGVWGDLDSIPAPTSGPVKTGLSGLSGIMGKKGVSAAAAASPLLASLHKDKSKFQAAEKSEVKETFVEGPPVEIDEKEAKAKIDKILGSANPTSDYIFATPGLDARMLGRIDGWVSEIEQKDKYTDGHTRQVAEYATAIASEIGLSQKEIETIRQAALVHDVGKLGSAPQILQKPDEELSDPELITVMKHPLDGAELLESFPDLQELAPIVRAHHEEFDGNGYPQGLKGEEIPLAARIIHVANSYHEMISPMVWGPGMDPKEAQQEMINGAGKQWEPKLVEALLDCMKKNR
jgi:putative nucleotidyltransferase with HDIG domain